MVELDELLNREDDTPIVVGVLGMSNGAMLPAVIFYYDEVEDKTGWAKGVEEMFKDDIFKDGVILKRMSDTSIHVATKGRTVMLGFQGDQTHEANKPDWYATTENPKEDIDQFFKLFEAIKGYMILFQTVDASYIYGVDKDGKVVTKEKRDPKIELPLKSGKDRPWGKK